MAYQSKYTGLQIDDILDSVEWKQGKIEDLASIRAGAQKGATALQSYTEKYTGTVTGIKINGVVKSGSGVIDLGTISTTETDPIFSASPAASITEAKKAEWDNKVDKVSGKQLSTEDFTTALKTKLEGLNNYDDTELSNAVETLRGDFDEIVSGDTTTAIKTFNEVIAFLDGLTDTQDLESIIASIEQQIAGKMDKVTLATVATSGSYNDLSNKPTIPTKNSQLENDSNFVTPEDVAAVALSGSYNDLHDAPTIPAAVTESTVSGWGFTKNIGTYSKPSGGIPKSDLASAVQTSLGKADTALQSYTEQYKGTITGVSANGTSVATSGVANIPAASTSAYGVTKLNSSTSSTSTTEAATPSAVKAAYDLANSYKGTVTGVKINGTTKNPSSGIVDLGTVITAHQDISGKQDKLVSGTNIKNVITTNDDYSILGNGDLYLASVVPNSKYVIAKGIWDNYDVVNISTSGLEFIPESEDPNTPRWSIHRSGDGTKFLSDDGTYKIISGGGSSSSGLNSIIVNGTTNNPSNGVVDLGYINKQLSTSTSSSMTLSPNIYYRNTSTSLSTLTITLGSVSNSNIINEYFVEFTTRSAGTTVSLPSTIKWANGEAPTFEASTTYQISIVNNLGVVTKFK